MTSTVPLFKLLNSDDSAGLTFCYHCFLVLHLVLFHSVKLVSSWLLIILLLPYITRVCARVTEKQFLSDTYKPGVILKAYIYLHIKCTKITFNL